MNNELRLRIFAGFMILVSAALVHFVSPWWLLFTAFIGLNLIQSAFTGFCPPLWVLRKIFPESSSCGRADGKCADEPEPTAKSGNSCGCGRH
ncbi:MAG TPA: DUF2892 domain-containing protein [Opitutaceae bacterium]|nr:DUF2892 domain-containing protein [Opitutaceae bacterium]